MSKSKYYRDQLNKIFPTNNYPATFQFSNNNDSRTNWMDLNIESIKELIKWLEICLLKLEKNEKN